MDKNGKIIKEVIGQLKTVYDPEFSFVDLYTMGLFYDIQFDKIANCINILMTYTTPSCPMGDMMQQMVKNAIREKLPEIEINITITFDPLRKIEMIKDEDLQKLFK